MSPPYTKYITVNRTGDKVSLVDFGTALISNNESEDAIYTAIMCGYPLIDGAVGCSIKRAKSEGIVNREYIVVIENLGNHYHAKEHVKPIVETSFKNLDYIDVYLLRCEFCVQTHTI